MNTIKELVWLIQRSLIMDKKLLFNNKSASCGEKIEIILKKYTSLIRHKFKPFVQGHSFEILQNEKVYYNSPYGIAGYQAVMCEHIPWISRLNLGKSLTIIDVGANVGYFSIGLAKILPDCVIYGIEPNDIAFKSLQKNTTKYKNINNYKVGVGSKKGKRKLFFNDTETAKSSFISQGDENSSETVDVVTIDGFVKENKIDGPIDILKIDVEGFELEVLKGAKETLKKTKYIHMEINQENYNMSDVFDIILKSDKKARIKFIRNFSNNPDDELLSCDVLLELV